MTRSFPTAWAALVLLTLTGAAGCGGDPAQSARPAAPPPLVKVAPVLREPLFSVVEAIGTTRANESVTLTAKVSDTVRAVRFDDGDQVQAGAILVELTDDEETALLAEADADVADARRQLRRLEDLVRQNSVPVSQVDEARARYQGARARQEAIMARLDDRLIRAPFAGVLGFRNVSEGTLVTTDTPVTTLDDISVIKLDFSIPEIHLGDIAPGQQVLAASAAFAGESFEATVRTVGSRVDPVSRAVTVRAHIDNANGRLRPGMLMTVRLLTGERQALTIADTALVQRDDQTYLYVVEEQRIARQQTVQTGIRQNGRVELLTGVAAGDLVVVEGTLKVRDGLEIRIAPPADDAATAAAAASRADG